MSLALAYSIDMRALHARWRKTHAPANTMNLAEEITAAEHEFGTAMDRYKTENHRVNPTFSEVLAVLLALGYVQMVRAVAPSAPTGAPATRAPAKTARKGKDGKPVPTASHAAARTRREPAKQVCTKCNRPLPGLAPGGPNNAGPNNAVQALPAPTFPPLPAAGV